MKKQQINKFSRIGLACALFFLSNLSYGEVLDRIVAIVENDVVLDSELDRETAVIIKRIEASKSQIPPDFILRKQVLERLIVQKLQHQLAERSGVQLSDEMIQNSVAEIAQSNNMGYEEFRVALIQQGIDYQVFEDNIRNEIIISQLRAREIGSRVQVTDREVTHYLETQAASGLDNVNYHLGHILISVPETASSAVIQAAKIKADKIVNQLQAGEDFKQLAIQMSDDDKALSGGDLGWRTQGQMPTLFVDVVGTMGVGDISKAIRSPSGFHIIKVLERKGGLDLDESHIVTKTKVRHILVKTNELVDDSEAKSRLHTLIQRIEDGDSFEALARSHSDDKGSALKGGSLDWVMPGALVPKFEQTMQGLEVSEISQPIQTQFGWHIIQVLDRKQQDNSSEHRKNQVKEEIRRRKIEEETELWLRRLRDEAFVKIHLERL